MDGTHQGEGLDGEAVKQLLQGAVLKGRDPLALLREAGIDPATYGNAEAAIDGRALVRLVRRIQLSLDDVYLGFFAQGCRLALESERLLSFLHCGTFGEALRVSIRFTDAMSADVGPGISEEDQERIFVNKYEYKLGNGAIGRGDLVVFHFPLDPRQSYIKRVIGLPGDRIQMKDGVLYINGMAVKKERVEDFQTTDAFGQPVKVRQYRETLPNGRSYNVLDLVDNGYLDTTDEYVVPAGHYFMMGDNRDNSTDSRVLNQVGYVPYENLVGRAEIIFFSVEEGEPGWMVWRWPWTVRWDRLLHVIR